MGMGKWIRIGMIPILTVSVPDNAKTVYPDSDLAVP